MALGTAAVVRMRNGFPLMPPIPPRIADQLSKRKLTETPDVILVAEDYRMALDIAGALRWAKVVGIVAAHAPSEAPIASVPAVVNVSHLLDEVKDDMLMVVDADHNLVIVDPDGLEVAHYQAERDKIAPRRRLFLDDVHLPAETIDGRVVLVLARVETPEEIAAAVEKGADTLYVPFNCALLPADTDELAQRRNLLALIDKAAGKPLLLADEYALPPMLLLETALRAEIMLAVPLEPHLDGLGLAEFGAELNDAQAECLANDAPCERPKLAVLFTDLERLRTYQDLEQMAFFMDRLAMTNVTRLVLDTEHDGGTHYEQSDLPVVDLLVAAANATMLPVIIAFDCAAWNSDNADFERPPGEDFGAQVRFLVGVGASGVITSPGQIEKMKAAIRELNFSECREAVSEALSQKQV
jgi:phosphotransferase system enzyme I (PtsI)